MKNINLNTLKIVTLIAMTAVIIATSIIVAVGCQNGMFNFENEETTLETEIVTEVEESLEERYATVFAWQTSASDFGTEQLYLLNFNLGVSTFTQITKRVVVSADNLLLCRISYRLVVINTISNHIDAHIGR